MASFVFLFLYAQVVFVRGLPPDCLESELLALCCPFAVVEKCLLIPPKRSAFVQLPDVASATNLISFYQSRDAIIRGSKITFEFSNRDEISVRPEFDNQYGGQPMHAPHMQHQQQQQQPMSYAPQQLHQPAPYRQSGTVIISTCLALLRLQHCSASGVLHDAPPPTRRGIGAPNAILMVSVSNIQYDVTVDVLQQVWSCSISSSLPTPSPDLSAMRSVSRFSKSLAMFKKSCASGRMKSSSLLFRWRPLSRLPLLSPHLMAATSTLAATLSALCSPSMMSCVSALTAITLGTLPIRTFHRLEPARATTPVAATRTMTAETTTALHLAAPTMAVIPEALVPILSANMARANVATLFSRIAETAALCPHATTTLATALVILAHSQVACQCAILAAPCATTSLRHPCSSAATWTVLWR